MWLLNTGPVSSDPASSQGYTGPTLTESGDKFAKAMENAFDYKRAESFFYQLERDAKKMGQDVANGVQVFQKAIEETILDVWRSTQDLGVDMKTVTDITSSYAKELKKIPNISQKMIEDMVVYSKATGMAANEVGAMVGKFAEMGIGQENAMKKIKKIYDTARKYGVDANTLTATVRDNLSKASTYGFKNGVEGLTKMAARAQQLGTDFKNIMTIAEKALDPDNAIQMAAEMQMLGGEVGALGDPFQLLYMAQNDIGKLQEEFTKVTESAVDFNEATGEFKIPVQEMYRMRAMAEKLGINNYDQIADAAIKAAKLKEVVSRIKLPASFDEEDKNLIASLAEIKGGEVMITMPGTKELVNAANLTESQLEEIKNKVGPEQSMQDIAKQQLGAADNMQISLNKIENTMIEWFASTRNYSTAMIDNMNELARSQTNAAGTLKGETPDLGPKMVTVLDNLVSITTNYLDGPLEPDTFKGDIEEIKNKIGEFVGTGKPQLKVQFSSDTSPTIIQGKDMFIPRAGNEVVTGSKGEFFTGIPEDDVLFAPGIKNFLNSSNMAFETLSQLDNSGISSFLSSSNTVFESLNKVSGNKDIRLYELIAKNLATPSKPTENLGISKKEIELMGGGIKNVAPQNPEIDVENIFKRSVDKIMEIQNSQNTQTSTQKVEGNVGVDGNVNINVNIPDGYLSTAFSSDRDFQTSIKEQILNVVNYRLSKAYSQGQGNLG